MIPVTWARMYRVTPEGERIPTLRPIPKDYKMTLWDSDTIRALAGEPKDVVE